MANPIEIVRDYLGSVANRAVGRSAWIEAMQRPEIYHIYHSERGPWVRAVDEALNHRADLYSTFEVICPATSRLITPLLRATEEGNLERYDLSKARFMIPTMAIDIALLTASVFLGQNLLEVATWKLGGNVAFQVGSDLAHRIRGSRPPTASTLAV